MVILFMTLAVISAIMAVGRSSCHSEVEGIIWAFASVGFLLLVAFFSGDGDDKTCPNYGESPAVVDGEDVCIDWSDYPELQDEVQR